MVLQVMKAETFYLLTLLLLVSSCEMECDNWGHKWVFQMLLLFVCKLCIAWYEALGKLVRSSCQMGPCTLIALSPLPLDLGDCLFLCSTIQASPLEVRIEIELRAQVWKREIKFSIIIINFDFHKNEVLTMFSNCFIKQSRK